jgi:hypothetical protein
MLLGRNDGALSFPPEHSMATWEFLIIPTLDAREAMRGGMVQKPGALLKVHADAPEATERTPIFPFPHMEADD